MQIEQEIGIAFAEMPATRVRPQFPHRVLPGRVLEGFRTAETRDFPQPPDTRQWGATWDGRTDFDV